MLNKPKILSNELDQVAKRGEWYRKELLQPDLADQIADALTDPEDTPMGENDFFIGEGTDEKVLDWFLDHSDKLPMEQIGKMLKDHSVISCEIARIQHEKGGWTKAVGPAIPKETISLGTVLSRTAQEDIAGYDITYLTFVKTAHTGWPTVKISLQQVGFPGKADMVPQYAVFHNEVKGKEVEEVAF